MEIGRNQNIYLQNVTYALMPSSNPRGRPNPSTLLNSVGPFFHIITSIFQWLLLCFQTHSVFPSLKRVLLKPLLSSHFLYIVNLL